MLSSSGSICENSREFFQSFDRVTPMMSSRQIKPGAHEEHRYPYFPCFPESCYGKFPVEISHRIYFQPVSDKNHTVTGEEGIHIIIQSSANAGSKSKLFGSLFHC